MKVEQNPDLSVKIHSFISRKAREYPELHLLDSEQVHRPRRYRLADITHEFSVKAR